jgi:PAS domain-containing protein
LAFRREDGSDLAGLVSAAPLQVNGTFLGSVGIITDITRCKQAEAELRQALEFNDKIINGITDHLTVINPRTYEIVQANNSFLVRVGKDATAVLGKRCYEILMGRNEPCDTGSAPCPVRETFKTKSAAVLERVYPDALGQKRLLQVMTYPLFDERSVVNQVIRL